MELTLRGRKASEVAVLLADAPRKVDVPEEVVFWLTTKGPRGTRGIDLQKRTGTLVQKPRDMKSVLLVGLSEATLAAKCIIEGLHLKRRQVPQAVVRWLTNSAKGAHRAREMDLEHHFDTCISMEDPIDDDPSRMVDLAVVGEREEDVNDVLAIIGIGLH
ncbi:hypothetical protein AAVH_13882 [Aphelenchoides avenae]|nr:hypothetical protein AAVH_13882 [Aphelenchus avenae]